MSSFFSPYAAGKTVEKGKKMKKLTFQHFRLTPTYLKITFVSFFLLLFFMNLSLKRQPTQLSFHPQEGDPQAVGELVLQNVCD